MNSGFVTEYRMHLRGCYSLTWQGAAAALLAACASASPLPPARVSENEVPLVQRQQYQTIIKMKDKNMDPSSSTVVDRLSVVAGARVSYLRQIAGGAHVVVVVPVEPNTYGRALQNLRDSGLVEYVENDALMHPAR